MISLHYIASIIYTIGLFKTQMTTITQKQTYPHSKILFDANQILRIQKRFQQFAENGAMNITTFKRSMGLLGIGQCQFLCDRIFPIITGNDTFDFDQFLSFLNIITYGSKAKKARISFDFLDKSRKGYISYSEIEMVISEISFIWNFLTGEKISNSDSITLICDILGIKQDRSISFQQYINVYDNYIEWYDYFNNQFKQPEVKKHNINIDQIEQYLRMLYSEVQTIIGELRQSEESQQQTHIMNSFSQLSEINSAKGPTHMSFQQIKPKGDHDNPRQTIKFFRASTLSRQIVTEGSSKIQIATKKLEQFSKIGSKLFPQYCSSNFNSLGQQGLNLNRNSQNFHFRLSDGQQFHNQIKSKKKALLNITQPDKQRKRAIYFGHQNWNIMLNMMLGIRKSLKSYFYKFDENIDFTEQDLTCKYVHELIYKQNNKSVKQISEMFVDYSPKVFFYVRSYFQIENHQFLKSIGLQNLIGNLLMGNLTGLTDQSSEGKSGSFIYYTEDTKLIIKSISKQQYKKLRDFLGHYAEYVKQNPGTFLLHIYGLYKLKNKLTNRQIYFIVINNFFETSLKINERYDIKGSTHNRQSRTHGPNTALKDIDFIKNNNDEFLIEKERKQKIFKQISRDSQFLSEHNITQYSLLIGISRNQSQEKQQKDKYQKQDQNQRNQKGFMSTDGKSTYFFGIIDILTQYSAKKVLQNHFLHIFISDISCLAPNQYCDRFKTFLYKNIFSA